MKYWPSIWRGLFYFTIEVATVWHKELASLVKDHQMPTLCAADWWILGLASYLAGALAVRAYFDGTHGRLLERVENGAKQPPVGATPNTNHESKPT